MKITIDKSMTLCSQLEKVKEDGKEFKTRYTDGDLLRAVMAKLPAEKPYPGCSSVIRANVSAFPKSWDDDSPSCFFVELLTANDDKYIYSLSIISFSCDIDLNVDDGVNRFGDSNIKIRAFKEC